jgi:hypothetical protein
VTIEFLDRLFWTWMLFVFESLHVHKRIWFKRIQISVCFRIFLNQGFHLWLEEFLHTFSRKHASYLRKYSVSILQCQCRLDLFPMLMWLWLNIQVGYAEKIANVWAKVTEETSVYVKESSWTCICTFGSSALILSFLYILLLHTARQYSLHIHEDNKEKEAHKKPPPSCLLERTVRNFFLKFLFIVICI